MEDQHAPLTITDLPLEMLSLISDFVSNFDNLAHMTFVCHRFRDGVLGSRQWMVVEEVVAAVKDNVWKQRMLIFDRRACAKFACREGLLRLLRGLALARHEITMHIRDLAIGSRLEVLEYLHTVYSLTPEEMLGGDGDRYYRPLPPSYTSPLYGAAVSGLHEEFQYLHTAVGVVVPRDILNAVSRCGHVETLKYLHTSVGLTGEDVRLLNAEPLRNAAIEGRRECLVYLREGYALTKEDAQVVIDKPKYLKPRHLKMIEEVFELPPTAEEQTCGYLV